MSGFVDTVYVAKCPSDGKITFLKGNVSPFQKLNDDPHKVWICIERTGKDSRIVMSWCTCTAGTAEACNHVIALLYKVNYAFNKDFISPACTSIPQGWNKGTKREVTPTQLRNLTFRKDKKTRKASNRDPTLEQTMQKEFDPRKPEDGKVTNERVSFLLNSVKEMVPSACVLFSVEHGIDDTLPPSLIEQAAEFQSNKDVKDIPLEEATTLFLTETQISQEQVKRIEQETREQHSNPLWRQQRIGRITASNFHNIHTKTETIIKRKGSKKPQHSQTVFKLMNESDNISHLPQIKWGWSTRNMV